MDKIRNGLISNFDIFIGNDNKLTMNFGILFEGGCVDFGKITYWENTSILEESKGYLSSHIYHLLKILEKNNIRDIPGTAVRFKYNENGIIGIGHIFKNQWFYKQRMIEEPLPSKETQEENEDFDVR